MDSWVPEGEDKHSQSVIDLFAFVREAVQTVSQDLPLGEYKRAVYMVDLSKVIRPLALTPFPLAEISNPFVKIDGLVLTSYPRPYPMRSRSTLRLSKLCLHLI